MKKVLILGCGPAGLMAAKAAEACGFRPEIVSKKAKSFIGGAQYLHMPIPGITETYAEAEIRVIKYGTSSGYAEKVYGDPQMPTSFDQFRQGATYSAWDLRKAYDRLWELYCNRVYDLDLNPQFLEDMLDHNHFSAVFSTIPAPALCRQPEEPYHHSFRMQKVYIDHSQADDWGDNTIIYNGDPDTPWYRQSKIFGVSGGREFSAVGNAPVVGDLVKKPLSAHCDCWPGIVRLGRFGAWNKKLLTHHAYTTVVTQLR